MRGAMANALHGYVRVAAVSAIQGWYFTARRTIAPGFSCQSLVVISLGTR